MSVVDVKEVSFPTTWSTFADHESSRPLRAELFGLDNLEAHARRLGTIMQAGAVEPGRDLPASLKRNAAVLKEAQRVIAEAYRNREPLGNDAEWLLDNFHIISDALTEIQTDLPPGYYHRLPKLTVGPLAGYPRVYALALELTIHSDSSLDETNITRFVQAFQSSTPLTVGEVWAIPIMLRLCLVENLRRLAQHILQFRTHRERAKNWIATKLPAFKEYLATKGFELDCVHNDWRDCYIVHLLEHLHGHSADYPEGVEVLEKSLREIQFTSNDVLAREKQRQAANQVSIANCVTSLRLLSALDWPKFFEDISQLEAQLRRDPAGIYAQQDFATRDRYRARVEKLAYRSGIDELTVARLALQAARDAQSRSESAPRDHVGYYLIDDGAAQLEAKVHYRPPVSDWLKRALLAYPRAVYFGGLVVHISLLLAGLGWLCDWLGAAPWLIVVALFAALLPVSELAVNVVNWLITAVLPPRTLPSLDFEDGIPTECATFVVIPTLLTSQAGAAGLVERLEIHYLANSEKNLFFGLLTDYTDAPAEQMPEDNALLQTVADGIDALNRRYAGGGPPLFFLFHRRRQWNAAQGCWMGWERKRGKLAEFNRLLRGATDTTFAHVNDDWNLVPPIRFVITLDTDTQLPRETALRMIALLAHPINQPHFDPGAKRMQRGYAIIQPRIAFSPRSARQSWFAAILGGSTALDPYATATSDTYQDLFASGSFTGKGIYDVDGFEAAAGNAFPDNHILSHDLIEGNYARCALATNIELLDDIPSNYLAYLRRDHRWIRGDWQIAPWLLRWVPGPAGAVRNALGMLERWKILDNLRRSAVPISLLVLLALGWTVLPGSPWIWTGLAALVLVTPLFLQILNMLLTNVRSLTVGRPISLPTRDLFSTASHVGMTAAFLPAQAHACVDAIVRTLWRLAVTKCHLLEWETSALTERRLNGHLTGFARAMWFAPALAVAFAVLVIAMRPEALAPASAFLLAWFVSPGLGFLVSQPRKAARPKLSPKDEEELRELARKTWRFFETFVGANDNWLPPDNYQEEPKGEIAHRTSPTNIGMYLLCCLAAHDFGFLNLADLLDRLEKTLATLGCMEQAHGHFYNWYDTQTLQPLHPIYLSTVDSGNLAACLITLKQGLLEKARLAEPAAPDLARRGRALAEHADRLAAAMDFTMLYNAERHLFAVGFNLSNGRMDNSHYDLMASEASLTSFLAIARGEAPRKHWFHLGRPLTEAAGHRVLVSWGGTMFEYLMPRLMLPIDAETLLGESQFGAVAAQIDYGRKCGTPWGISESAFYAVDGHLNYQYQAFGAPALGLKRGLGNDLVVAPYATGLALMIDAPAALANLGHLRKEGAEGEFGCYEAIDYTSERLPKGRRSAIVKCYMAHHQGMILVALANCLLDNLMPRRFRAEPMVRATELLLQEKVPVEVPLSELQPPESALATFHEVPTQLSRRITTPHTSHPRTHMLASARYAVMLTNAGGSKSIARGLSITRWREDATCDAFGQFLYVRDFTAHKTWSAAYQPLGRDADEYEVTFAADKVEFRRVDGKIETRLEITVSPEHHAEVRRIIIVNHDREAHDVELTSYAEIVLLAQTADEAHPVFGKLFLETEFLASSDALICRRRPRAHDQKPIWCVQAMAMESPSRGGPLQFETDRARFLGRGRTPADPAALDGDAPPLSGTVGAVLDPIFSLRRRFRVEPESAIQLALTTGLADSRDEAIALANTWKDFPSVHRAFELAWAHTQVELRQQHWTAADTHLYQRLAGHIHFAGKALRAPASVVAKNRRGQADLWHLGISGDLPIVLLRIASTEELPLARQVVTAHSYWRFKGMSADLVILNDEAGSYFEDLQHQLHAMVRASEDRTLVDKPGGAFVRKAAQLTVEDLILLQASARCVLIGSRGLLGVQLDHLERALVSFAPPKHRAVRLPRHSPGIPDLMLTFDNEFGGFTPDGKEYIVRIAARDGRSALPPQPWCNVIANANFGTMVSTSGGGFTWAGNSQMNRLTPWRNDPVSDVPAEVIYLRDEVNGEFWSATPAPRGDGIAFTVRHGQGYTTFLHQRDHLACELTHFVARDAPIKFFRVRFRNLGAHRRRLSALFYAELVLGTNRAPAADHIVTELDAETGALFARNAWHADRKEQIAFADVTQRPRSYTADRSEFIGRNGSLDAPAGCASTELRGTVGACLDPCAAMQAALHLDPQEEKEIVFILGEADSLDAARRLIRLAHEPQQVHDAWEAASDFWDRFTTALTIRTPNNALDMLVNRWLPYQSLSCRMWGRSALYQSGGAFGFRDQLQDSMGLVYAYPDEARRHILRAARHQFLEGDALHWWHDPSGVGVRTRCSDDFLWLPFVVHHYITTTGDHAFLEEAVEFLQAPELLPDQEEDFRVPATSEETASIFEHCIRAIDRGLRFGAHGLPLMGAGDWNDGMNRVGIEGRGESVWLGWFLLSILRKFADLCETRGNADLALAYREQARELNANLETHAWDGAWYRRAYFDDGRPLGSAANEECRIDSLPQSWGVISGGADPERVRRGMAAVNEHLVRPADRLVLLFTPPFDKSDLEPGYIKGYVPGIRENGGQYTHGALWVAQAWALLGDGDRAMEILDLLNPILHADSREAAERYRVEPYVIAADIYGQPPHVGRGGWSWYTGSASWYYRVAIEAVLGFELLGDCFRLQPRLPVSWPSAELTFRYRTSEYRIRIVRSETLTSLDDQPWTSDTFPLRDDGIVHTVVFSLR